MVELADTFLVVAHGSAVTGEGPLPGRRNAGGAPPAPKVTVWPIATEAPVKVMTSPACTESSDG